MAELFAKIQEYYNYVFYDLCDYRTRDVFPTPIVVFTVIPCYVYFTKILGPRMMEGVQPFQLKNTIFYYNIFQILISAYVFYEGLMGGWLREYSWTCQPVDMEDNPTSRRMLNAVWWYLMVKFIDLIDTVFFVLRKKDRQISFLHVFHHAVMPMASFIAFKYFPNGHATLLGVINCLVHVVMYTYYLIAGLGPQYQKYLWWKKHLTTMQIVQFAIIFIHNLIPLMYAECDYPRWISWLLCIHSVQFIYMFGDFYYQAYIKAPQKSAKNATGKTNGKSKLRLD